MCKIQYTTCIGPDPHSFLYVIDGKGPLRIGGLYMEQQVICARISI